MKTKFTIVTIVIAVMALFASCGGKRDIWKDIKDSDEVPEKVWENIRKAKYDLNTFSPDGYTFLTKFLPSMDIDDFNACVKAGVDVNLVDANGIYPLFVCLKSSTEVRQKLFSYIKDFNVKDSQGRNAYCYVDFDNTGAAQVFLEFVDKKLDVNVWDDENELWPYYEALRRDPYDNSKLINLAFAEDFVLCPEQEFYQGGPEFLMESLELIKEAQDNPLTEFSPSNKKMDPPEDAPENFLLMPGLIPSGEWAEERAKKIDHYLMCDMKLGSQTYKAGTRVVIDGYADPENADIYSYVDGVFCHDYKIHIGNDVYKIPQRYISMYSSEYTFPGTNETVLLLSTFAITDPNDDSVYPSSFLEVYDYEFIKGVDVVLVKGNSAYKIDTSEEESGFCYNNLQIMDGSKFAASPVIHGSRFYSPVNTYEGFYYLCGNKLKFITLTLFTAVPDEADYGNIYKYKLIFDGRQKLTFEKKIQFDDGEVAAVKDVYVLSAPYVWEKEENR
ncbi:hypothetical protein [Treponema sp.]|uniref:hypothetical protein n=1 Tax=Treponema sp. TaxID=166 RepID=UPI00298E67C7|nr:hypothetical protein [Treponema sp.]MCR5613828.1 hypothetical protein [Treponema sp.]